MPGLRLWDRLCVLPRVARRRDLPTLSHPRSRDLSARRAPKSSTSPTRQGSRGRARPPVEQYPAIGAIVFKPHSAALITCILPRPQVSICTTAIQAFTTYESAMGPVGEASVAPEHMTRHSANTTKGASPQVLRAAPTATRVSLWPGTVADPGLLPGEPDLIAKVTDYPTPYDADHDQVVAVSPATGEVVRELAPWQVGGGIDPLFVTPQGAVLGTVGEGLGMWGVGVVPVGGRPRIEPILAVPCSTHPGLALSPDGHRLLWLVGTCAPPLDRVPALNEYDLSGKQLAVSSHDGAISPESWGGPAGAYVAGYLPPQSKAAINVFFGPLGVGRLSTDGVLAHPVQLRTAARGCLLAGPCSYHARDNWWRCKTVAPT